MSLRKPALFALICLLAVAGADNVNAASTGDEADASVQATQPSREQPARDEFVPIDELPPNEQLPAARFLVMSYVFAWVAILVYVWSIWRRLGKVERELTAVEERLRQQS